MTDRQELIDLIENHWTCLMSCEAYKPECGEDICAACETRKAMLALLSPAPGEGEVEVSVNEMLYGTVHENLVRVLDSLRIFVRESLDPGTEALSAIYCAERVIDPAALSATRPAQGWDEAKALLEECLPIVQQWEFIETKTYSYGDGRTEPLEWGIDVQYQQQKPHEVPQYSFRADVDKFVARNDEAEIDTLSRRIRALAKDG